MDEQIRNFFEALSGSLEELLACLDGLDAKALDWRPVEGANSLYAIALHTLSNAERNVMSHFLGEPYVYDRTAEFAASASGQPPLRERWETLRKRMEDGLSQATAADLLAPRQHQRMGSVPGQAVLVQVVRHAAEHVGEARLTRQLLDAR